MGLKIWYIKKAVFGPFIYIKELIMGKDIKGKELGWELPSKKMVCTMQVLRISLERGGLNALRNCRNAESGWMNRNI